MAKRKFNLTNEPHGKKYKKTSINRRRPKKSSMNKDKKRNFKPYNRQGK